MCDTAESISFASPSLLSESYGTCKRAISSFPVSLPHESVHGQAISPFDFVSAKLKTMIKRAYMGLLRRVAAFVFCVALLFVIVKYGSGIGGDYSDATDAAIALGMTVIISVAIVLVPKIRESRSKK
jgi:hypothetical protein